MSWARLVGGLSTASSIGAASFGFHGLSKVVGGTDDFAKKQKQWEVAQNMHFVNSVALTLLPAAPRLASQVGGGLIAVGTALFSGSIYAKVYTGDDSLGKAAPVGGVSTMLGYIALALIRR
mmetsp:Transcript_4275/g.8883  ORF Transcript_4275/g.8883 Transcript_4275/m.8883 type:complete len:121 (-) Transcript_4275:46-408(-)